MSVNISDKLADLHRVPEQLSEYISSQLQNLQAFTMHLTTQIISRFQDQLVDLHGQIGELRQENWGLMGKVGETQRKYQAVLRENKEYEGEFLQLMDEMKMIKTYIEELKKVRGNREEIQTNSPSKHPQFEEEDRILTKITSLNRLQKIQIQPHLDVIRQVTELSPHSSQNTQNQDNSCILDDFEPNQLINSPKCILSQSFECSSAQQTPSILMDNWSKAQQPVTPQSYESFEQSLSVLKKYCSNPTNHKNIQSIANMENGGIGFELALPLHVRCPILKVKDVVNDRHLVYEGGYVYTGATVRVAEHIQPMGFGQLFHRGELVYCGAWREGVFDGWGKVYLSRETGIKYMNGRWKKGMVSGALSIKYYNNDRFMGSMQQEEVKGEGIYFSENKPAHSGYWSGNKLLRI